MKLYIEHTSIDSVNEIVSKLIESTKNYVLSEKPSLDEQLIEQVAKIVDYSMKQSMNVLLKDSTKVTLSFDLETAVAQAFENTVKAVKWEQQSNQENE